MTIFDWLTDVLGMTEFYSVDFSFIFLIAALVILVIAVTLALNLFIGIAFAIFKR